MAELASARVKDAITSMLEEIDRSCMRRMQGKMHRCAADCCDNPSLSMDEVNICIESCSKSMGESQTFLQNELNNYQDRIQRCAQTCQDNLRDRLTPSTTETQMAGYKKDFESCVVKCADTHMDLIPAMLKRVKQFLNNKTDQI